jgi:hypothetical protein
LVRASDVTQQPWNCRLIGGTKDPDPSATKAGNSELSVGDQPATMDLLPLLLVLLTAKCTNALEGFLDFHIFTLKIFFTTALKKFNVAISLKN